MADCSETPTNIDRNGIKEQKSETHSENVASLREEIAALRKQHEKDEALIAYLRRVLEGQINKMQNTERNQKGSSWIYNSILSPAKTSHIPQQSIPDDVPKELPAVVALASNWARQHNANPHAGNMAAAFFCTWKKAKYDLEDGSALSCHLK
jgi:hypothetical protein